MTPLSGAQNEAAILSGGITIMEAAEDYPACVSYEKRKSISSQGAQTLGGAVVGIQDRLAKAEQLSAER